MSHVLIFNIRTCDTEWAINKLTSSNYADNADRTNYAHKAYNRMCDV